MEARIADTLRPGVAWMPFHYAGGANVLSDSEHLDPVSKIPGFKQIGVKIEKVDGKKAKELTEKARNREIEYYDREDPISTAYREHTAENLTGSVQA